MHKESILIMIRAAGRARLGFQTATIQGLIADLAKMWDTFDCVERLEVSQIFIIEDGNATGLKPRR